MKPVTQKVDKIDHVKTGAMARAARMKSGKPLKVVASDLGCSIAYLSDLELGRRSWNETLLKRFEKAL